MTSHQPTTDDAFAQLLQAEGSRPSVRRRTAGSVILAASGLAFMVTAWMVASAVFLGTRDLWGLILLLAALACSGICCEMSSRRRVALRVREAYQVFRRAVSREIRCHGLRVLRRNPDEHWFETNQGVLQVALRPGTDEVVFTLEGKEMNRCAPRDSLRSSGSSAQKALVAPLSD